jgi:endonuclease YncB( thermonuclease family)
MPAWLRSHKVKLFVIVTSLLLLLCGCAAPADTVKVVEVIDGDTITIEGGYRVRYIGIDTPEVYPVAEDFDVK